MMMMIMMKHVRCKRKPKALRGEHEHMSCGDSNDWSSDMASGENLVCVLEVILS